MKHKLITIILTFLGVNSLYAQLLDNHSTERDIIFEERKLYQTHDSLCFKRILIPLGENENRYSIRNGKEVLVLANDDSIFQHFDEIDGYSSLFLDLAKFDFVDLNNDGLDDLVISIEPHEALQRCWVYKNQNNKMKYLGVFPLVSYQLDNEILKIERYAIHDNWADWNDSENIVGLPSLKWIDYFKIDSDSFINVNHIYKDYFIDLSMIFQNHINFLEKKLTTIHEWDIEFVKKEIEETQSCIQDCDKIINSKRE